MVRTLTAAGFFALLAMQNGPAGQPLTLSRSIELPRVDGRIDHLAIDSARQHLFVAALGNNTVEVVDVAGGTHLRSLPGFHEPQGIASVTDPKLIAVAEGQSEGVQLLDPVDFHLARRVALGDDADNVRYDEAAKVVYVGYGGGAIAGFSATNGTVLGRAKLQGHPESFQLEHSGSRIFVNVPTAGHIAVVDRKTMNVAATWPVTAAAANYPMALDEAGRRLFVGCRRPAKVLVYDTGSGKLLGATDIVGDTDDVFYDASRQRLYVSGGEGFIDVLDARQSSSLPRLARVAGAAGARTSLFVPDQRRLYLAVPHRGAQKAEIRVFETRD